MVGESVDLEHVVAPPDDADANCDADICELSAETYEKLRRLPRNISEANVLVLPSNRQPYCTKLMREITLK
jgi:hypothetical protein